MRQLFGRGTVLLLAVALVISIGCGGKKKGAEQSPQSLSAEATYIRGMEMLSEHKMREANSMLKRIQFTPDLREDLEPLARLALADATFHQGGDLVLIEARNLYLDFVTLNGDHALAPYAQLQAGLCSLLQVNHPSKDQYQTHQAIEDLRQIERRWPNSAYINATHAYLREAGANLAESEYLIGRFYLNRKSYPAAVQRFSGIVERYPDYHGMEDVLFDLGLAHLRSGNSAEGRIYMDKLVTDYPSGVRVNEARKALEAVGGGLRADVQPLPK